MINKILTLFLLLGAVQVFGQATIGVVGKLVTSEGEPIEAATVFLSVSKDSTLVEYTSSNAAGVFDLKFRKQNRGVYLTISMIGYQDFRKNFEHLEESIDLGVLNLVSNDTDLEELVIQAEAPPIRVKTDTLEFNASSFKVRPDANVEELLKQLPGVEIDADKKVTVNGREVSQFLVNGKPFFNEDGQIALQNLPSDLINKVQISDYKTKKEEFTKQRSSSDKVSLNLTIDEDKNKGMFGRIMAGQGSDKRYEGSGLVNYFKGVQKISVLGSSNNINASGFSMDEVFDNMRGGRSGGRRGGGKSSSGITKSSTLGVNYNDAIGEKVHLTGSYNFNDTDTENQNRSTRVNLLPSGTFTTISESNVKHTSEGHNGNFSVEYKIDSTAILYVAPIFSKSLGYSNSNAQEFSEDEGGARLNESQSVTENEDKNFNFSNSIRFTKLLSKRNSYLSASFVNSNSSRDGVGFNESFTRFYNTNESDDIRKQLRNNNNTIDSYYADVEFARPIHDSLSLVLGIQYSWMHSADAREVLDYNEATGNYEWRNVLESNTYKTTVEKWSPTVGVKILKHKFNLDITSGLELANNLNTALYAQDHYASNKHYIMPQARIVSSYQFKRGKMLFGNYSYSVGYPTGFQVLDIEDVTNPLNTIVGNPNLKPNDTHSAAVHFNNYNFQARSGYSFNVNTSLFDNQIVTSVEYDENRKRTTFYTNLSGSYRHGIGGNWNKSYKWDAHQLRFGFNGQLSYSKNKGFTDGELFVSKSITASPSVYLNWSYGELLTIMPSYSYSYFQSRYDNYSVRSSNNFQHNFQIQTTTYWPKNWIFGNDFGYSYNSKIAPGFKKSFYLWNTSLSYRFYEDKFMAKVKVYDLLNQNVSATRTLDPTMILDQENTVLKRYIMVSLSYKFNSFGGSQMGNTPKRMRYM